MITKEELRQLLETEGYNPEEIDEMCARHFHAEMDMQAALDAWVELLKSIEQAFKPVAEMWERLLHELATAPPPPKKNPPRPPRNDGPQNKGRSWTRQPPRLARSCCRKIRR